VELATAETTDPRSDSLRRHGDPATHQLASVAPGHDGARYRKHRCGVGRAPVELVDDRLDLLVCRQALRDRRVGDVLERQWADELDVALLAFRGHPGGLDHVYAYPLAPGCHEQLRQPWSDIGVHPARPCSPRVQLDVSVVGGIGGMAEAAGEVDLLDDQHASAAQSGGDSRRGGRRIGHVREQESGR
jgi:hypothetical protein